MGFELGVGDLERVGVVRKVQGTEESTGSALQKEVLGIENEGGAPQVLEQEFFLRLKKVIGRLWGEGLAEGAGCTGTGGEKVS